MGFFSWKTNDVGDSIPNVYSEYDPYTVYMVSPDGQVWEENEYDGYGVFGGKDFYELVAELNGKKTRTEGIRIWFHKKGMVSPNLVESKDWEWINEKPEDCEYQGYFYPGSEHEEITDGRLRP